MQTPLQGVLQYPEFRGSEPRTRRRRVGAYPPALCERVSVLVQVVDEKRVKVVDALDPGSTHKYAH